MVVRSSMVGLLNPENHLRTGEEKRKDLATSPLLFLGESTYESIGQSCFRMCVALVIFSSHYTAQYLIAIFTSPVCGVGATAHGMVLV